MARRDEEDHGPPVGIIVYVKDEITGAVREISGGSLPERDEDSFQQFIKGMMKQGIWDAHGEHWYPPHQILRMSTRKAS